MPHLHLPIDHTDADLVLAVNVAEIVGSEDLYVAWSHESGAGAVPEVDAVLVEAPRQSVSGRRAALVSIYDTYSGQLRRRRSPTVPHLRS